MRNDFYFDSTDEMHQIHGVEWIPEGEIRGIIQICHGMVEHIARYDRFASFMMRQGYYVIGHDHLGHGLSVKDDSDYGYFPEENGNQCVIGDIHKLRMMTQEKYPQTPYIMMGHSMGSFLLRQYLGLHGEGLDGAIIMGTGHMGLATLIVGQSVCRWLAGFKGWRHRSAFLSYLTTGHYNKRFEKESGTGGWMTSDAQQRDKYNTDAMCDFQFQLSGFYQMMEGMKTLTDPETVQKIPKDLPIVFLAGADDPVGGYGRYVCKIYKKYKKAGIRDVSIKLYPGNRHEILNDTDWKQVHKDIYVWVKNRAEKTRS